MNHGVGIVGRIILNSQVATQDGRISSPIPLASRGLRAIKTTIEFQHFSNYSKGSRTGPQFHVGSIGKGKSAPVPKHLDYDLWQGPVPARPYKDNLVHYNWHWHWLYGGGELANNGVHALDIARWALGVDTPKVSSYTGGRYHHDDDQETPDTADATYDFGKVGMSWHGSSCLRRKHEKHSFVSVYGDGGVMAFDGGGYRIYDNDGKLVEENAPGLSDVPHFQNFVDAIRKGEALNAEISDAQKSTMLCHLGNISYREGIQVKGTDVPKKYWQREYAKNWKPTGI